MPLVTAHSLWAEFLGRDRDWLPPTEETPQGLQDSCFPGCEYLIGWRAAPAPWRQRGRFLSAKGLSAWQTGSGAWAADRGAKAGGSSGPYLALGFGMSLSFL